MTVPLSFVHRLSAVVALSLVLGSCAGPQVREQADVIAQQIQKARASGAERCAPRELAVAETNHDFALTELDQGNAGRADAHVQVASVAVQKALVDSKDCAPTKVIIKEAKVAVRVERTDNDGDGIPNASDACPEEPGPAENNGCPVRDRDGDGIPDDIDMCPEMPEDFDGFEDDDGCPDLDNDKDGLVDTQDRCPNEPGPLSNYGCPVLDRDGDGIPDDVDRCPDAPEDLDGFEDADGCPDPDNDQDGVLDVDDACPLVPGIPELKGCPPTDRDRDGVPDHIDLCPDEEGVIEEQGCPRKLSLVVLRKEKIEIKEQVHFATGKHQILRDSFELLNQVAQVLRDHPRIKLRIEGHTDSQGNDDFNMKLSQRRADAVREYLVRAGISDERMVSVGFGETAPIASNSSERGRALNRRVEFNITER